MNVETLANLVGNVGVPSVIVFILLYKIDKTLVSLNNNIIELKSIIKDRLI